MINQLNEKETIPPSLEGVRSRFLNPEEYTEEPKISKLIWVLEPKKYSSTSFLSNFCRENRSILNKGKNQFGALLFRGFDFSTPEDFRTILISLGVQLDEQFEMEPQGRKSLIPGIFEASSYKNPWIPIMPHTEMFYSLCRPMTISFFCLKAPKKYGETPLVDFQGLYEVLPDHLKTRFDKNSILFVRNFPKNYFIKKYPNHKGNNFDTEKVKLACQKSGYKLRWLKNRDAQVKINLPAIVIHPKTGCRTLNYQFFSIKQRHVFLAATWRRYPLRAQPQILIKLFQQAWFNQVLYYCFDKLRPQNVCPTPKLTFTDGTDWSKDEMNLMANLVWDNSVFFRWKENDLLVLDNFRVAHSKMPTKTTGRKILAAIGDMHRVA